MQGIQKLWFKVILAIQTEVQTNITRQKDRSILLFDVFAVGNIIPYHCLLKYTKTWRILWDYLQAMDTTHSLLHYSYDSSLVFLKLSHDHYQYLWEKKSWFPWKLSISSSDSENGKEDGPGIPTARTASCQTMAEVEAALKMRVKWTVAHSTPSPATNKRYKNIAFWWLGKLRKLV